MQTEESKVSTSKVSDKSEEHGTEKHTRSFEKDCGENVKAIGVEGEQENETEKEKSESNVTEAKSKNIGEEETGSRH